MAKRKGRKFPKDKNKDRRERRRQDGPTPERAAKHVELVKRQHTNSDDASSSAIAVLHAHGEINDMQKSTALAFTDLHYRFKQQLIYQNDSPSYAKQNVGGGSVPDPIERITARQEEDQRRYFEMSNRLAKAGRLAEEEVLWVCRRDVVNIDNLYSSFKPWTINKIFKNRPLGFWETRHNEAFHAGLNALIEK